MSRPSDGGVNKGAKSPGRYSTVILSVSLEVGGEEGLAKWIGASRSVVFLQKCKHRDIKKICITLASCNQIHFASFWYDWSALVCR